MKKGITAPLSLSILFLLGSILSFLNYFDTGCTSGRWGFGSCGKEAIALPIASLLFAIFCLFLCINIIRSKDNFENLNESQILICPKCEKVIEQKDNKETHVCSECNVEFVPLEGFYNKENDSNHKD